MEKNKLTYDKDALIAFMNEKSMEVPIAFSPYNRKVMFAEDFLVEVNRLCGITQEEFQSYISDIKNGGFSEWTRDEFIDKHITGIQHPGVFKIHGYEKVGNRPYIYIK